VNLVEKILARAGGRAAVAPGDIVVADVDRLIMHDLSGYLTAKVFEEQVRLPVRHPDRVIMVFDHHFAPATERQAEVLKSNREWARRHGIRLFDCGSGNIHHAAVRHGLIRPGMIVVGSDSHTPVHGAVGALAVALGNDSHAGTVLPYGKAWFKVPKTVRIEVSGATPPGTSPRDVALWLVSQIREGGMIYAALEIAGSYVTELSFWDRWLFPLIAVDVGAKCGYVEPDETTRAFIRSLPRAGVDRFERGDPGETAGVLRYDVGDVGPQIACPPTVGNVKPVAAVAGTEIQWAELGGHGGGRLEDIRLAAGVLRGRGVHPGVRFNIVPSSREVFAEAVREGLVLDLHEAGATWFPPSTGSNQAANMGAMAAGEAMISTHARNFPGRNGSPRARMYLASALTVAASALAGAIADPRDVVSDLATAGRR
jgi:3-isopropylmalate/(R)-2-methylmalate dehydratase large subunit